MNINEKTMRNKIVLGLSALALLLLPTGMYAAADANLVNAAGDLSTSVQENVIGTVFSTAVLTVLAVIVVGFAIIAFVTRFVRRHAK